jgi:hypothetical protein
MTKDEALKMAIDYLDGSYEAHKVRKACQKALEQPTVAELNNEYLRDTYVEGLNQPAWQGLTDDEIDKVYYKTFDTWSSEVDIEFANAIEQALKEKNND